MKVGVYARVSTGMQGESLEEQIRILVNHCEKRDYEIFKVYSETSSGAKTDRAMFMELMRDVEAKKFDAVVVLKLDRFSRSMLDLLTNVERLKANGIDFISVKDNIETATAQGKLMFHLMGAFGEFERSLIYERTKVGIDRAKREGKICHRPRKKVDLDRVVERYNNGIPLTQIAIMENVSYSTLRSRLRESKIKLNRYISKRHFTEEEVKKIKAAVNDEKKHIEKWKAILSAGQLRGKKAAQAKGNARRRHQLGYTVLMPLKDGEVGHHVTNEYVIGIPEEVHINFGDGSRERHRAKVLEWLKVNDIKKYKIILTVIGSTPC